MKKSKAELERKNLMVNGNQVQHLKELLDVSTASEAVRVAVDRTIQAQEALTALKRLRSRQTWGKNLRV